MKKVILTAKNVGFPLDDTITKNPQKTAKTHKNH
jgi:hypothetical protein